MWEILEIIFFIILLIFIFQNVKRRNKIRAGEKLTGKIVEVTPLKRLIIEIGNKKEKKKVQTLESGLFQYSKKNIGEKIEVYYNKEIYNKCSLVEFNKWDLKKSIKFFLIFVIIYTVIWIFINII
ncbi:MULTISPECIES: hypothetical protein [Fusobacterium]|uniref:hypothetical protein n=1 Tax=Fusobacterium TaxID=848 RepID=UPI0014778837|nr:MULTISPECIES: hypothetical protein [Fusobacterium]NME36213.1 hypothetical protein [Fusobacterium sp. FSA-380-WT-3A]